MSLSFPLPINVTKADTIFEYMQGRDRRLQGEFIRGRRMCPCPCPPPTPQSVVALNAKPIYSQTAESNRMVESLIRNTCIVLGNSTGTAGRPLNGNVIKEYTVPNTISQAWYLGRAVHLARQTKLDFIKAIVSPYPTNPSTPITTE